MKKEIFFLSSYEKYLINNFSDLKKNKVYSAKFNVKKKFNFVKKRYPILLNYISNFLNKYHKVNHPVKYWELIIGYWLIISLSNLANKYFIIRLISKFSNKKFKIFKKKKNSLIFSNSQILEDKLYYDTNLNYDYYKFLVKNSKSKIQIKKIAIKKEKNNDKINFFPNLVAPSIRQIIIKLFAKITSIIFNNKNDKIYIVNTYLGFINETKLQKKINGKFKFNTPLSFKNKTSIDSNFRNKISKKYLDKKLDYFSKIIIHLLVKNIPVTFLENYKNILNFLDKKNLPHKPKVILTNSDFFNNDVFKIWCAEKKIKNNTKIFYGIHGGGFQSELFSTSRLYLKKICDKIFIWGKSTNKLKIISQFNPITSGRPYKIIDKKNINNGNILLIQFFPFYFDSRFESTQISMENFIKYVNFQKKFIAKLNNTIQKKIVVRLGSHHDNIIQNNEQVTFEKKIWKLDNTNYSRQLNFELRKKINIRESIMNSYVVIITHVSSTTLLECLSSNIPFLILADLKIQLVNKKYKKMMLKLKKKNIFFDNPQDLAFFLNNKTPSELLDWWFNREIQKIISSFRSEYSAYEEYPVNALEKKIRKYLIE